jgi:splicing factor 3B subunit 3
LEYLPAKKCFDRVHQETYGKTGCRRIVPGQYLAVDPKGRALLIGAIERQKLVYILNRDAQANLTISSPLEAHKNYSVCFAVTGIDVGFENPAFACLEVDYEVICLQYLCCKLFYTEQGISGLRP